MDLTAVRAALADTARRARVPGMSLAVVSRDGALHTVGTGFADLDGHAPATADTVYPWFSMTKPVTATAALRLSDRGLLDLHAPVHAYLPWLRAPGPAQPTVWQLLSHSAGLGNPLPVTWIHPADAPAPDQEQMLRKLMARRRAFRHPVGGTGHYSNVGYLLAAQIISQASGEPFPSYVQREILAPLGMASTGFAYLPGRSAATGYVRLPRPLTPALAAILPPGTLGARHGGYSSLNPFLVDGAGYGGLVGSVLDAAAFARLHLNDGLAVPPETARPEGAACAAAGTPASGAEPQGHRILQESTARAMRDIHVKGRQFDHSAGWFRKHSKEYSTEPSGSYVEHFGTGLGFWNIMRLYPEQGRAIVLMSNSSTSYDYTSLFSLVLRLPWT
jgi:CubicO group peptidase (beta-lactamase class C family)